MTDTYLEIRHRFGTGDVLLVEGRGIVGQLIRAMTGQQFSHVAVVLILENGVFLAEMVEGSGYQIKPVSEWIGLRRQDYLYFGRAPALVRQGCEAVKKYLLQYRGTGKAYSYWTLITVWLAQLLRIKTPADLVCSTFAQGAWEAAGYSEFYYPADPGDFGRHCTSVTHFKVS